jgi:hypothetical protein
MADERGARGEEAGSWLPAWDRQYKFPASPACGGVKMACAVHALIVTAEAAFHRCRAHTDAMARAAGAALLAGAPEAAGSDRIGT